MKYKEQTLKRQASDGQAETDYGGLKKVPLSAISLIAE